MKSIDRLNQKKEAFARKIVRHFPKFITPNLLSLIRLLLLPLIIYFLIAGENISALIVFAIAFMTDFFDGPVARYRRLESNFGVMFDGFVDKVVFVSTLLVAGLQYLPPPLVYGIIFLDVGYIVAAPIVKALAERKKLRVTMKANIYGKLKMFFEFLCVVILLANPLSPAIISISSACLAAAIILSVTSIVFYIAGVKKIPTRAG